MATSKPVAIVPPPGVIKTESDRVVEGRYSDTDKIRFSTGRAQKIGGWTKETATATSGRPRALHAWRDLQATPYMAAGTYRKLYAYDRDFVQYDITPLDDSGTLGTDPFAVVEDETTVTVTDTLHGRTAGDTVSFDDATAGGGITIDGEYQITTVVNANSYTIEHSAAATSTDATTGGASVAYEYELTAGTEYGTYSYGYGVSGYGLEGYGDERSISTIIVEPRVWSLDNWGELLLAAPGGGRSIYEFDPGSSWARAAQVTNAPDGVRFMYVIPERFVIALMEDMEIRWSSQSDHEVWTPAASNTAGAGRRVTVGTKLVAGAPVGPGYSLIWSDAAVYIHQWTGSRLVFDTRLAGTNCGLIAPSAQVSVNGIAYWMGTNGFWLFAGGVMPIPNQDDIKEYVFQSLRQDRDYLCAAVYNPRHNEVWWLYAATTDSDLGHYVIFDVDTKVWAAGTIERVSGAHFDHGDTRPYMGGGDGHIYLHEEGYDDDGAAMLATLTLAPTAINEGESGMKVDGFMADFHEQAGEISIRIDTWDRLRDGVKDTVTFTMGADDSLEDVRVEGRYVGMVIESNTLGGYFRMGKPVAFAKPGARRR